MTMHSVIDSQSMFLQIISVRMNQKIAAKMTTAATNKSATPTFTNALTPLQPLYCRDAAREHLLPPQRGVTMLWMRTTANA